MGRRKEICTLEITPGIRKTGQEYWRVSGMLLGERVRKEFASESEASAYYDAQVISVNGASRNSIITYLSYDRVKVYEWLDSYLKRSFGIEEPNEQLFMDVFKGFRRFEDISWSLAVSNYLGYMETVKRRSADTICSVKSVLTQIGEEFKLKTVSDATVDTWKQYLSQHCNGTSTANTYKGKASGFYTYLLEQGQVSKHVIKELPAYSYELKEPGILSHEKIQELLDVAGSMLPYYALLFFSPCRPDEIKRLNESEDIVLTDNLDTSGVWVRHGATKTRRRFIPLLENCWRILRYCQDQKIPLKFTKHGFNATREAVGLKDVSVWVNDVARHTYASNRRVAGVSVEHLAEIMRNSVEILWQSYLTHVDEAVGKQYHLILPECVKKSPQGMNCE